MKSKVTLLVAAFALLISFAFITVNKSEQLAQSEASENIENQVDEPGQGFAMEDEGQWE